MVSLIQSSLLTTFMWALLALTFYYFYRRGRERYLYFWTVSHALLAVHLLPGIHVIQPSDGVHWITDFSLLLTAASVLLLVYGTVLFLQKPFRWYWNLSAGLVFFWVLLSPVLSQNSLIRYLPVYLFTGWAQIFTGYNLTRKNRLPETESRVTGSIFLIEGIHSGATPFLLQVPNLVSYHFIFSILFSGALSLSILILYFRKVWEDAEDSHRLLKDFGTRMADQVETELTKQRKQEEILHQQARLISMNEMMRNVSHHWRQPLSGLDLLLQDIQDARDAGELTREYLDEAIEQGMQKIRYMSSTLDLFQKTVSTGQDLEYFNLFEVIREALSLIKPLLIEESINLECICPYSHCKNDEIGFNCSAEQIHLQIQGYKNDFRQVLFSILQNAIDSFEPRQKEKTITIRVNSTEEVGVLRISDTGKGIPEKLVSRIFEPYFTTGQNLGKTGLGLYTSRIILESMGGRIQQVAERGPGTTMEIRLPLKGKRSESFPERTQRF